MAAFRARRVSSRARLRSRIAFKSATAGTLPDELGHITPRPSPIVPRETTSAPQAWANWAIMMAPSGHPCQRRACETVPWLTSTRQTCGHAGMVLVPVSDPTMHSGSAYPLEVMMSRAQGNVMSTSLRISNLADHPEAIPGDSEAVRNGGRPLRPRRPWRRRAGSVVFRRSRLPVGLIAFYDDRAMASPH